jgi:phosphoglycolate phosphatase-like HAD superfamily hydrolase
LKNKLIAFDMDGTLIDSSKAIGRFLVFLHLSLGLKPPLPDELRGIQAESASEVLASIVTKVGLAELDVFCLVKWTNCIYPRYYMRKCSTPVPGVRETIRELSKLGFIVIISSNVGNAVKEFISWEGIEEYVGPPSHQSEYESKGDRLADVQRKNGMSSSNTVYVGDSPTDMKMGRDLGVRTIGVLRLSSSPHEVSRVADQTVMDVTEIPGVLKKWEEKGFFRAA